MDLLPYPLSRAAAPLWVDLDATGAVAHARCASRSRSLHVQCGRLTCQRTLGVSHVVSQLLLLRRAGSGVWLHGVNPPLLQLGPLFHIADDSACPES